MILSGNAQSFRLFVNDLGIGRGAPLASPIRYGPYTLARLPDCPLGLVYIHDHKSIVS